MIGNYIFNNSLYNSIDATVGIFIIYILVGIIYLKDRNKESLSSKIFFLMFLTAFINTILNILVDVVVFLDLKWNIFLNIFGRLNMVSTVIYISLYILYLTADMYAEKFTNKKYKLLMYALTGATIIIPLAIFLPLNMEFKSSTSNGLYLLGPAGPATDVIYVPAVILFIIYIVLFFKKYKTLKKEFKISLLFSFATLLVGATCGIFFETEINIYSLLFMLFNIILFFTAERTSIKLIETLENKRIELEKSNKVQEDFLSTVSHDIRTPMNVIMGYSNSIINDKNITPNEIKNNSEYMSLSIEELYLIINRIIDVSKISSGVEGITEEDFDLITLIQNVTKKIEDNVKKQNIGFSIDVNPDIPYKLHGDREKLYEIITLLLHNIINCRSNHVEVKFDGIKENDILNLIIRINHTGSYFKKEDIEVDINEYLNEISNDSDSFKSDFLGVIIAKELIKILNGTLSYEENINTWYEIKIQEKITNEEKISDTELYKNGQRGDN